MPYAFSTNIYNACAQRLKRLKFFIHLHLGKTSLQVSESMRVEFLLTMRVGRQVLSAASKLQSTRQSVGSRRSPNKRFSPGCGKLFWERCMAKWEPLLLLFIYLFILMMITFAHQIHQIHFKRFIIVHQNVCSESQPVSAFCATVLLWHFECSSYLLLDRKN